MLFSVYRSVGHRDPRAFTVIIEMAAARGIVAFLGNSGLIGLSTYCDESADATGHRRRHGLRDILSRPLSRGASRRRGSGNRLLHHVSRDRPRGLGFGPDRRRRGVLSAASPGCLIFKVWAFPPQSACSSPWRPRSRWPRPCLPWAVISVCSTPSARWGLGDGGASAPPSSAGPAPILVVTIAVALIGLLALPGIQDELRRPHLHARRLPRPTSATRPRSGIFLRPG